MDNNEKYELLLDGEVALPSTMGIIPNTTSPKMDYTSFKQSLEAAKHFKLLSFADTKDMEESDGVEIEVEYMDETYRCDLYINKSDDLDLHEFGFANRVNEGDLKTATTQEFYLETSMYFGEDALASFHLQLKIMDCLVPNASLVVDFSSLRILSAKWLAMASKSDTPPAPLYLYTIHGVYDENKETGKTQYWLHSHGLHRCSIVELEILDFGEGADEMNSLINTVVTKFLEGMPKEKERFTIGYDGMGMNLCWVRWEDAMSIISSTNVLGGLESRAEEDGEPNIHAEPSGVLFAVEDGNIMSPAIYAKTLADNPIFYISSEETLRMSMLAKERYAMYKQVFDQHGQVPEKQSFLKGLFKKKEEAPQWVFLAKIGLTVDDAETETDKEHLWFKVSKLSNENIEGELVNQPYWIASLNEGDVKSYPYELLTDWIIYGPEQSYTPDSIYELGFE